MARPDPTCLFVAEQDEERHVALWRRGRLTGYRIDAPNLRDRTGGLFLGRVIRVDPALGVAFVAFDKSDSAEAEAGLLPLRRGEKRVEGERLLVQVASDRRGEKSARLTAAPILTGRFADLLAKESGVHMTGVSGAPDEMKDLRAALRRLAADSQIGLRLTSRAAQASPDSIVKEAAGLAAAWQHVSGLFGEAPAPACLKEPPMALLSLLQELPGSEATTIVADNRTLARRVEAELTAAQTAEIPPIEIRPQRDWVPSVAELGENLRAGLDASVPLTDGGWILFEPGETLTAVDVNSGNRSSRRTGGARADLRLKLNLQAVETIAQQLRLRAVGGLIVIDFVDMEGRADRDRVIEALRGAFADDPARIRILPMSDLGLVQMTRQRRGPSLAEIFLRSCKACEATGRLMARRPIGNNPL
jgi:Rne/Rng family ribonuclease